jgi:hypothetical protein
VIIDKYPQLESHKKIESPENGEEEDEERKKRTENENHLKVIIILLAFWCRVHFTCVSDFWPKRLISFRE